MKKNKLIIFFLFYSLLIFSQKKYNKEYYSNGVLKEEGWTVNNEKEGYWFFYHSNSKLKQKGHFKNNLPANYWYFYRENGSLEKEGHYENGKQNKWWVYFDSEGKVNHKCQFKDDLKNGYCLMYNKNKLISASKFINDKKIPILYQYTTFMRKKRLEKMLNYTLVNEVSPMQKD